MSEEPQKVSDSFDVFVSHASEDRAIADRVEALLQQHNYRCFLAVDDLNELVRTKQWSEALEGILSTSPVLVLIVTQRALDSRWVTFEWRSFHDEILSGHRTGLIVPLLLEHRGVETLPLALKHWQMVDVSQLGEVRGLHEMVRIINGFREAARASTSGLEQGLRWSVDPVTVRTASSTPAESVLPKRKPALPLRWLALGGLLATVVAACAIALVAFRGRAVSLLRENSGSLTDNLNPRALAVASTAASAQPPAPEPREGWQLIEAFSHRTLAGVDRVARPEGWIEAKRAFADKCSAEVCSPRDQAALHFVSGELARLSGSLDEARREFEASRRQDQTWAVPLLGLAFAHGSSNPKQAREFAREAYRIDPSLWLALAAKAAAFSEEHDYVSASQELIEARTRAPAESVPIVDGQLAMTYHAESLRNGKASELAKSACTESVHVASACAVLAEQALEARNPNAALRFAELADRNDFVPLALVTGDALQMKHDLEPAWAAWRRAVALKDRAENQGAPPRRLLAIEEAVKSGHLPPPRIRERSAPERSSPSPPAPARTPERSASRADFGY